MYRYIKYHNLGKRCSSWGRSFQTIGPATENARFCIAAVRANVTTRTPPWAGRRDRLPGPPTRADSADTGWYIDPLGRQVQVQVGIARPERQLYTGYAAGQEANAEHSTYIRWHDQSIIFLYSTDKASCCSQHAIKTWQSASRQTSIKCWAVVKAWSNEGMDKSRCRTES